MTNYTPLHTEQALHSYSLHFAHLCVIRVIIGWFMCRVPMQKHMIFWKS